MVKVTKLSVSYYSLQPVIRSLRLSPAVSRSVSL